MLLCNPLGDEALQAHRLYRVLAEQLEQSGFTVLRFDYGGTGDSGGGEEAASITGWISDIEGASRELARAAPGTRLIIVGLRLGATLAALATARLVVRARQLVLWDPVVDGLTYLRELANAHRQYMAEELQRVEWQDRLAVDSEGVPHEALGMPLTELARELRHINLVNELPVADLITVISTRPTEASEQFRAALATRAHSWIDAIDSAGQNRDAALNAATVPMDIIRQILASVQTNP